MSLTVRRTFLQDATVATAIFTVLYGPMMIRGPVGIPDYLLVVTIPGYLLVAGFDLLENAFGSAGAAYPVLFGVYLVGLGLVAATAAHLVRRYAPEVEGWRLGVGSALALVGTGGLLIALVSGEWDVLATTGSIGLVLLGMATWLLGLGPMRSSRSPA
jgi:chromate transport protein ChrA